LRQALVNLSSILEKIDQGKGTLGQLINDPSVHQSLKSLLGGSPRNRYMKDMIRETIQQSEAGR
jgi:phospholipid/cholesterol/gamma-HCH transport system substrate-binding protein